MASGNFTYRKVIFHICIVLLFCIVLFTPASATTWTVCPSGCNFTSIQEAINSASDGDTIEVMSGKYNETIVVNRSVTLTGIRTAGYLPDVGKDGEPVIVTISAPGVTFEQFWVHGASENALVLEADVVRVHEVYFTTHRPDTETDPIITGTGLAGVEISNCMMDSEGTLGIFLQDCSQVFVLDNRVSVNPDAEGTAIAVRYTPQAGSYSDISIEDNRAYGGSVDVSVMSPPGNPAQPDLYYIRICNNMVDESSSYGIRAGGIFAITGEEVFVPHLHNVTVEQNTVTAYTTGPGIGVAWAGDGAIRGNSVSDGSGETTGLMLGYSNGFSVAGNTVTGCDLGIYLDSVENAVLSDNTMAGNTMNFGVEGRGIDEYRHAIDTTNTVDGRPVYYLVDQSGAIVDGSTRAGTVYIINCTDVAVSDVVLRNNMFGLVLMGSDHSEITNVTATGNSLGFRARDCSFTRFRYCSATDNDDGYYLRYLDNVRVYASEASSNTGPVGCGIWLHGCSGADLLQVTANSNTFAGIDITRSDEVVIDDVTMDGNDAGLILNGKQITVTGCHVRDNRQVGIGVFDVEDAWIWNNYFNNEKNVDIAQGLVTGVDWNVGKKEGQNIVDGPFTGGNYWAKPDGTGWSQVTPDRGDGFCTAPFVLDGDNVDSLPLHLQDTPPFYADFTAEPCSGDAPLTVQFTDASSGEPFRWYYQFGDGYSSTSPDPVHTYRNPGTYTVTLSIMKRVNTRIVTTTTEKVGYITVNGTPESQLEAKFTATPVTGEAPLAVTFTDTSTGDPTGYRYSFGDIYVSSGQNPVHTYQRPGTYDVQLTVWSTAGGDLKSNTTVCRNCITVT